MNYQDIIEKNRRESLFAAIDQDIPDAATAERAKARVSEAVTKLREYVASDAEKRVREGEADYPRNKWGTEVPKGYAIPLALAEEVMDVLRELAGMGVVIRVVPDELSVERCYRLYITAACKAAWAEGVNRAPDPLDMYLRGNN